MRTSERKIACVAQPFTYTLASMQCLTVFAHLLCWTLVLSFTCFYVYREKANDVVSVIEEARNTLIIEPEQCLGGWAVISLDEKQ